MVEYNFKIVVPFSDLWKAYDSVTRSMRWLVLQKLGFPEAIIALQRSFHECMKAQVKLPDGRRSAPLQVSSGLRQGCTIAPAFFNIDFAGAVCVFAAAAFGLIVS